MTDPNLIYVRAVPTSTTEYVVRVDVLDAVLPELLRTLAADRDSWTWFTVSSRLARMLAQERAELPNPDFAERMFVGMTEKLAELLRGQGVGVLHLTPEAVQQVTDAMFEGPDFCERGACAKERRPPLAGMCPVHDADAARLTP